MNRIYWIKIDQVKSKGSGMNSFKIKPVRDEIEMEIVL